MDPKANDNVTAERITELLVTLASDHLELLGCEVCEKKKGPRLYTINLKLTTNRKQAYYEDLVVKILNDNLPIQFQITDTFYNLRDKLVLYLKIVKSNRKTIKFVRSSETQSSLQPPSSLGESSLGHFRSITFDGREMQEAILKTSIGTMTKEEETEDSDIRTITTSERKGAAIPYDYANIKRIELEAHLMKPDVREKVRLLLSYLQHHREEYEHHNGHTYFSVGLGLRCLDFPKNIEELRDTYFGFCKSQGFTEEEVEKDLLTYRRHLESQKVSYYNNVARAYRLRNENQSVSRRHGPCDPECTIL